MCQAEKTSWRLGNPKFTAFFTGARPFGPHRSREDFLMGGTSDTLADLATEAPCTENISPSINTILPCQHRQSGGLPFLGL